MAKKPEEFDVFDGEAEVVPMEEFIPDPKLTDETGNKGTLSVQAKKTSKALEKVAGIERIIEILNSKNICREVPPAPTEQQVNDDPRYADIINRMIEVTDQYSEGEINFASAQMDVLRIGSDLIYLSQKLGRIQAMKARAEFLVKRAGTMAYVEAKRAAREEGVKLSDSDAKELAALTAIPLGDEVVECTFAEKHLFNAFHSLRTFQEMLNYVTGRELKVNSGPNLP